MTPRSILSRRPAGPALTLIAASIMAAPIAAVLWAAAGGDISAVTQGPAARYAVGTALLCLMVGIGAGVIGAGAAAAVCLAEFPGRRLFAVLLALPFAIPAYIAAYAYGDFLGPFGPVADLIGAGNLPEIRTLPGAAFILTLATYPYVYLAMAASLSSRSGLLIEAARMLGAGPFKTVWSVLLAASRPAFAGGLALALMETAGEFGVADYFGVPTLSVGIFRTWYGLGDLSAATQIAALLFFAALVFVFLEQAGRRGRAAEAPAGARRRRLIKLSPVAAMFVVILISLPIIFGFVIPAGVLVAKLDLALSPGAAFNLGSSAANTARVAGLGAAIAIAASIALAYSARRSDNALTRAFVRIATLGYAVPGAVIAIGILTLAAWMSRTIGAGAAGGLVILLYAYAARFTTAAFNAVAGGLAQISPQMDAAARNLGANGTRIIASIHWPQTRGAVLAGAAIVAIDIAKELPATLLLRPFNFETLATRIYRLASDERLADAAPAALILIGLGLIPVLILATTALGGNKDR
jgi:iron(III) transport system permease protein